MTEDLNRTFAKILRQATGIKVMPHWGQQIRAEEVEREFEGEYAENGILTTVRVRKDSGTELSESSSDKVVTAYLIIDSFATERNTGAEAVVKRNKELIATGFTNENGEFGEHDQAPFQVGGEEFLIWRPLNKIFDEFAKLEGTLWTKRDVIETQWHKRKN